MTVNPDIAYQTLTPVHTFAQFIDIQKCLQIHTWTKSIKYW